MASLGQMPQELLDNIASQSEFADLKSVRLISQNFAQAAVPHLFKELHMCFYPTSLERAKNVAGSDYLRYHVKHFVLH